MGEFGQIIIKNSTGITIKGNKITCSKCHHVNGDNAKCEKCGKDLIVIVNDK